MKTVIQRVKRASVSIGGTITSSIGKGLMVLVGIEDADDDSDVEWLCNKIVQLRIFDDNEGIMNLSVLETGGEILAVSQFTLETSATPATTQTTTITPIIKSGCKSAKP